MSDLVLAMKSAVIGIFIDINTVMLPERKKFRVNLIFPYKKYLSKAKLEKICDRFHIWYSLRGRTFF